MKDLKIYYKDSDCINEKFDIGVEKLAKKLKLEFAGSGYNFREKIRDIHFKEKMKR